MPTYNRGYTPATITPYRATSNEQVVTYNPQNQFIQTYPGMNEYSGNASVVPVDVSTPIASTQQVQPFSTLDNLNMQAQAWQQVEPNIANAYQSLASGLGRYSNVANQIGDFYNVAANQISGREADYANAQYQLANQLNQDIANQRDYIYSMFGPQGQLTQEINRYYDDMGNYLASEGGRQMANIAAQGVHSGASLGLLRTQQNEAYNQAFENYLKVKEQEINAKQSIQAQLIDYMTKLRQEYGNTTNQYILSQYQRANDLLNSLDADLKNQYTNLALANIQNTGSQTSSNSDALNTLQALIGGSSSDSITNQDNNNQQSNLQSGYINTSEGGNSVANGGSNNNNTGGGAQNGGGSNTKPGDWKDTVGVIAGGIPYMVFRNLIRG